MEPSDLGSWSRCPCLGKPPALPRPARAGRRQPRRRVRVDHRAARPQRRRQDHAASQACPAWVFQESQEEAMRATARMPRPSRNRPGATATMTATCGRAEQVQNRPRVFAWVVALVVLVTVAVLTSGCGGPSTASAAGTPRGRLLSVADLPAGWSAVPAVREGVQASVPCLLGLPAHPKGYTYTRAAFVEGTALPSVSEVLATGP